MKELKLWKKSRHANLRVYIPTGVFFLHARVNNKLVRRSLETTDEAVAVQRRDQEIAREKQGLKVSALKAGLSTFGELAAEYRKELQAGGGVNLKTGDRLEPRSRDYQLESLALLEKTVGPLWKIEVRDISVPQVIAWANRLRQQYSASRFNGALTIFRYLLGLAVLHGLRSDNPLLAKGADGKPAVRRAVQKKQITQIPTEDEFDKLVDEIKAHGWRGLDFRDENKLDAPARRSDDCGDLTAFLGFTGLRIHETWYLQKRDVELFEQPKAGGLHGWLHVRKTKNGLERTIPLFAEVYPIIKKWLARENTTSNTIVRKLYVADKLGRFGAEPEPVRGDFLTPVLDCYAAVHHACDRLGLTRLSHHKFRHFCATRWLAKGFSVATVAAWLGHKDNGELLLRTYTHIVQSIQLSEIARVNGVNNVVPITQQQKAA